MDRKRDDVFSQSNKSPQFPCESDKYSSDIGSASSPDLPIWNVQIREMKHLNLIRYHDPNTSEKKELRILDDLSADWEDIGEILGFRPPEINTIRHPGAGKTPIQCLREIIYKWMQNADNMPYSKQYPCTWTGLYNMLMHSKHGATANDLKAAITASNSDLHHGDDGMFSESRKDLQTSYKSASSPSKLGSLSPHPQLEISMSDDTGSASTPGFNIFKDVSGSQLSEADLSTIYDELFDVRVKWYNIGLALGVRMGTLDTFESEPCVDTRLRKMLQTWLCQGHNRTWTVLAKVLGKPTVGRTDLMQKLEYKYC